MKVILVFVLFGISFYQASGATTCSTDPATYAGGSDCVIAALKNSAEFVIALGNYLCEKYRAQKESDFKNENYNATATALVQTVECLGCKADTSFGANKTFEGVLKEIADATNGVGESVITLLYKLQLNATFEKALCTLAGDMLTSDCVKKALLNLSSSVITNMKNLYCEAQTDKAAEVSKQFADIMRNIACPIDKKLGSGDTLENLMGDVGESLAPLIKYTLLLTQQPLGDLPCGSLDKPIVDVIPDINGR